MKRFSAGLMNCGKGPGVSLVWTWSTGCGRKQNYSVFPGRTAMDRQSIGGTGGKRCRSAWKERAGLFYKPGPKGLLTVAAEAAYLVGVLLISEDSNSNPN